MTKVSLEKSFVVHPNAGKTFANLLHLYIESAAIAQSIHRENFCNSLKICKIAKLFSCVALLLTVSTANNGPCLNDGHRQNQS